MRISIIEYMKLSRDERRTHLRLDELCHACSTASCSNPHHLYWGTAYENNVIDRVAKSPWFYLVEKHGVEIASKMNSHSSRSHAKGGKGNAGKPKSAEHRRKLSAAMTGNKNRLGHRLNNPA